MKVTQTLDETSTLRVEMRFKNARLYNAIAERSVQLSHAPMAETVHRIGPIKAFCDLHQLQPTSVYELLNLKRPPMTARGLRPLCQQIATLLDCEPDWLFPAELYAAVWPALAADVTTAAFLPLATVPRAQLAAPATQEDAIDDKRLRTTIAAALITLTPREARIIRERYGLGTGEEQTLERVGAGLGVSKDRVRQLEARALRKLRHPRCTRPLRSHLGLRDRHDQRPRPADVVVETTTDAITNARLRLDAILAEWDAPDEVPGLEVDDEVPGLEVGDA